MEEKSVCPWWMGYFLLIPIRKFSHHPSKLVKHFIKEGMTVVDYGSAMGYFSIPMAKYVGEDGKVYCIDIQQKMLDKLVRRAKNAGVEQQIIPILNTKEKTFMGIREEADFVLLFAVAHEVPDREKLFRYIASMLKPRGILYFAEPPGHVSKEEFEESISFAEKAGFVIREKPTSKKGLTIVFEKSLNI
ncbi:MAG: methyltransferase domain-containing protein [Paludibacteraceae bacterium]|nr:methyltransferase domain-containing protein [Paludibacteraceae bacterium]